MMAVIAVFTGCQKKESAGGGQSGGSSKTITFFYWDENQRPGMDAVAQSYTRTSGVQVETTITPWAQYWTRLQTSLPSDGGPDVFWCNFPHAVDYYPANLVQEISTYIQRDNVDMSKFPKAMIDMYSYNGKNYGIPKDYDTIALFYNKAIFDAKGVPYPTDSWTWADLRRAAERLTDGNVHGFIAGPDTQTMLYPWVLSNNGTLISQDRTVFHYNTPETIEAVREAVRYSRDKLSPTGADLLEMDLDSRFQAGLAAMVTAGSWVVPPYYEALGSNLGVARFPISKKPANVIHGLSFNISARSRNKEEAWGLLKTFATKEAGEAQAKVVIPAYEGAADVWMRNFPSLNLKVFIDAAAYADVLPYTSKNAAAQDDIVVSQLQNIYVGGMDVAAALAAIERECEAAAR
jgi:multiple sugar transport system substrate-binding protein